MSIIDSSVIEKILHAPEGFSQHQIIRLLLNRGSEIDPIGGIAIHGIPFPDNEQSDISHLKQMGNRTKIVSRKDSLSSGNAAIPPYLQEILIQKYHANKHSLHDFINIFNHIFFRIDYRIEESSELLMHVERDQRSNAKSDHGDDSRPLLMHAISLVCGCNLAHHNEKWLQYSFVFGMKNRSILQLGQVLKHYFSIHLTMQTAQLQRQFLSLSEQSTLTGQKQSRCNHANHQLGKNLILGTSVWIAYGKLYITLFPEDAARLQILLQQERWKCEMGTMVRVYLRDNTEVIIQTCAPAHWHHRYPITMKRDKTVQLGRRFHLTSYTRRTSSFTIIHYRSYKESYHGTC